MNGDRRPIRSYVLRQGRLSQAQARARELALPLWGVAFRRGVIDLDEVFGRRAPRIVEIGFGMGETTVEIAAAHPGTDYLGIEVHTPGVGALLKRVCERRLTNVRVIQHDAVEVFQHMIAAAALDGVHVFFPDPWPKKRHHKRRLIQPDFVRLLATRLQPGGYVHLATDWSDYAEQMMAVLAAEPLLVAASPGGDPNRRGRPATRFEQRGVRLGHPVRDLIFVRRPAERAAADR